MLGSLVPWSRAQYLCWRSTPLAWFGAGWTLLFPSQYLSAPLQTILHWFWIAALVWPIGFWTRGHLETLVAGVLLVMGMWVLPRVTGLAPMPPVEIGATMVGLLMGVVLRLTQGQATLCTSTPWLDLGTVGEGETGARNRPPPF
jgi:hypothetical protein